MKNKMHLYYALMVLPCIATIVSLFLLPDRIPAHYGANNEVTRWGSKYETLLFPIITIIFGGMMIAIAKSASKEENGGENNKKVTILGGIGGLIIFNSLTFYFLYMSFHKVTNLSQVSIDLYCLLFIVVGVILIILGNSMPKTKMNSIMGFRTLWSIKNETVWKKCQRFAGITFICSGILMILGCAFFFKGSFAMIWSFILIGIMCLVDVIYSYTVARN